MGNQLKRCAGPVRTHHFFFHATAEKGRQESNAHIPITPTPLARTTSQAGPVPSLPPVFLCALSQSQLLASVSGHKRVHTSLPPLFSSPFRKGAIAEAAIVAPEDYPLGPSERLFAVRYVRS
jgi:hypothetical protein